MTKTNTRHKNYEVFKATIHEVLRDANTPLTWTEIRATANLSQKFPNNQWVHRMEQDIGLVREKTKQGKMLWKLREESNS